MLLMIKSSPQVILVSLNKLFFYVVASFVVIAGILPTTAFAQQLPSAAEMFNNFSEVSLELMDLVVGVSFVGGIIVTIIGLLKFREYSESGGRMKISVPLGIVAVGCLMVIMPGMINTATETLSLGANSGKSLLSQGSSGGDASAAMSGAITGILLFVKLIGHIAFFRGLLILKSVSEGAQGATMGRALTHLFGGAAAININATAAMLSATFGLPLLI